MAALPPTGDCRCAPALPATRSTWVGLGLSIHSTRRTARSMSNSQVGDGGSNRIRWLIADALQPMCTRCGPSPRAPKLGGRCESNLARLSDRDKLVRLGSPRMMKQLWQQTTEVCDFPRPQVVNKSDSLTAGVATGGHRDLQYFADFLRMAGDRPLIPGHAALGIENSYAGRGSTPAASGKASNTANDASSRSTCLTTHCISPSHHRTSRTAAPHHHENCAISSRVSQPGS